MHRCREILQQQIVNKSLKHTQEKVIFSESLYSKVFGVERHGIIQNYGSGNEAILFKRFV